MQLSQKYALALDVGNSNTVVALMAQSNDYTILQNWHFDTQTSVHYTSQELAHSIVNPLKENKIRHQSIEAIVCSSVVPAMTELIRKCVSQHFTHSQLIMLHSGMPLPLTYTYPNPSEIGTDRLANACAAQALYEGDMIIVDMGTATTFCVLHDTCHYMGGSIAPGMCLMKEAL